jgi:hypothetical protein
MRAFRQLVHPAMKGFMLETKEELVRQLTEAWSIIMRADETLERAGRALSDAHKDLRHYTRSQNASDTRATIRRTHEEGTPRS